MHGSIDIKVTPVLRTLVPPQGSWSFYGRIGRRGVDQSLLWQPRLPKWRKGKRRHCSRVAMATQILEASFEDQTHTLPTYKEVPRTSQDSLQPRLPKGMGQVLPVSQLTSQTFWEHKGLYFAGGRGLGLGNPSIHSRSIY